MLRRRCDISRIAALKGIVRAGHVCLFVAALASSGCQNASEPNPAAQAGGASLPRLVDLGAGKCIPCKRMAPILDELREEYAGSLQVVFIDVWQDTSAAKQYNIQIIPTQIFLDSSGNELFRHEGFFAKEEILAKWKALGFSLKEKRPVSARES